MSDIDYEWCASCGDYGSVKTHVCPPRWSIHEVDYHSGENPTDDDFACDTVYGLDVGDAAEKYAGNSDAQGDYECVGGSVMTVLVRKAGDEGAPWERYEVYGEAVAEYHAEKQ